MSIVYQDRHLEKATVSRLGVAEEMGGQWGLGTGGRRAGVQEAARSGAGQEAARSGAGQEAGQGKGGRWLYKQGEGGRGQPCLILYKVRTSSLQQPLGQNCLCHSTKFSTLNLEVFQKLSRLYFFSSKFL